LELGVTFGAVARLTKTKSELAKHRQDAREGTLGLKKEVQTGSKRRRTRISPGFLNIRNSLLGPRRGEIRGKGPDLEQKEEGLV